jgi:hypothetical protein
MKNADIFNKNYYKLQKKVIQIFGQSFKILDADQNILLYSSLKAFKLKEDIRVSLDEAGKEEVLEIHARQILDFSANYDITEAGSGQKVGTLQRKGFKSILKDEWIIKDAKENELGVIKEDNAILALVRRFVSNLVPQKYHALVDGEEVATFKQNFNPFTYRLDININESAKGKVDTRMIIAAAVLLAAVEGKQS